MIFSSLVAARTVHNVRHTFAMMLNAQLPLTGKLQCYEQAFLKSGLLTKRIDGMEFIAKSM